MRDRRCIPTPHPRSSADLTDRSSKRSLEPSLEHGKELALGEDVTDALDPGHAVSRHTRRAPCVLCRHRSGIPSRPPPRRLVPPPPTPSRSPRRPRHSRQRGGTGASAFDPGQAISRCPSRSVQPVRPNRDKSARRADNARHGGALPRRLRRNPRPVLAIRRRPDHRPNGIEVTSRGAIGSSRPTASQPVLRGHDIGSTLVSFEPDARSEPQRDARTVESV